jgi:S1-C subfamily serine protease
MDGDVVIRLGDAAVEGIDSLHKLLPEQAPATPTTVTLLRRNRLETGTIIPDEALPRSA